MNVLGIIIDVIIVAGLVALIAWNVKKIVAIVKKRRFKKRIDSRVCETIEERKEKDDRSTDC